MKFILTVLLLFTSTIFAAEKPAFFSARGIALKGYDVVAYFKQNKAVKGSKKQQFTYKGFKWHFSSKENLAEFKKSPEKYLPQYGGYCAYGLAQGGYLAKTEADAFSVIDGKLYLNYNKSIQKKWDAKKTSFIKTGDKVWKDKYAGK